MSALWYGKLLWFLVAVSLLVTVHEFGHYWVARRLGFKVLRFSVGFGRPLLKRVWGRDRTEYVLAAIPLGGYVKLLDEREGGVAAEELPRSFTRRPVWQRVVVLLAGPAFNIAFAVLLLWGMFWVSGITEVRAIVGDTPLTIATIFSYAATEEQDAVGDAPGFETKLMLAHGVAGAHEDGIAEGGVARAARDDAAVAGIAGAAGLERRGRDREGALAGPAQGPVRPVPPVLPAHSAGAPPLRHNGRYADRTAPVSPRPPAPRDYALPPAPGCPRQRPPLRLDITRPIPRADPGPTPAPPCSPSALVRRCYAGSP
jgi:regulator of sigma E protease